MMNGNLTVYRSSDRRYRTDYYERGSSKNFCIAERTARGVLVTEFNTDGRLINQVYFNEKNIEDVLRRFVVYGSSYAEMVVKATERYERVEIKTACDECNKCSIVRELDLVDPGVLTEISVVPTFRCLGCGSRFYSMTEEYLRNLVHSNSDLFEKEEIRERETNEKLFIKTLNEYIIRIFASKKIKRLDVR